MKNCFIGFVGFFAILLCSFSSEANDDWHKRKNAAWIEGGYSVATPVTAGSVALGVRFNYLGFLAGYGSGMDFEDKDVLDVAPVNPAALMGITSNYLGRKTVGPGYGMDIAGFFDLTDRITIYAGPGFAIQEYRDVYEITSISTPASSAWHVGGHYNPGYKKYGVSPTGVGGVLFKVANYDKRSLVLTVGYHSFRGVTAGLGFAF